MSSPADTSTPGHHPEWLPPGSTWAACVLAWRLIGDYSRALRDPGKIAGLDQFVRLQMREGARQWPERVEVFRHAVSLLDPVIRRILDQTNAVFLRSTGTIHHRAGEDRDGGAYAHWELSWPEQRHAAARHGGRVEPVQVIAVFGRGTTHPHLRGAVAGMWPCQVTDAADADRQEPILRAIVECELHERIFQGTWQVIPAFTSQDANAAN